MDKEERNLYGPVTINKIQMANKKKFLSKEQIDSGSR